MRRFRLGGGCTSATIRIADSSSKPFGKRFMSRPMRPPGGFWVSPEMPAAARAAELATRAWPPRSSM
ncbi:MAG: hypothetical protein AUG94_00890 [Actinobacteria bacterium 13_1_20CM_4_66_15]|nr:MAG: hypothetical protein AUG94_00890 [Actinobacteria bacterium 13_1_20CM_4_66_15]